MTHTQRVCANCGVGYTVAYRINATRLRQPSYCSHRCRIAAQKMRADRNLRSRFMANVKVGNPDECWEWNGRRSDSGYGHIDWKRRPHVATRVMWFLTHGEWPDLHVCHACDNPPCVNPAHLWLGTDKDNSDDKIRKGRARRGALVIGVDHHNAKLTPRDVIEIRSSRETNACLGKQYGTSATTIGNVRARRVWKHV